MKQIRVSREVLSQEVAGETVLLDLASESYFGLDEVGTRIWQMLQQGTDQEAMIETLLGEYDVGRDRLHRDIQELLDRLEESGLVERV